MATTPEYIQSSLQSILLIVAIIFSPLCHCFIISQSVFLCCSLILYFLLARQILTPVVVTLVTTAEPALHSSHISPVNAVHPSLV